MSRSSLILLASILLMGFPARSQKVGVVLSGGGARGIAHIGVLKALEDNNIPIDYITGTSIGALVGGLYAMGYSPQQMMDLVSGEEFYNWANGIIDNEHSYYFKKKDNDASWITLKYSGKNGFRSTLPTNIVNPVPLDFSLMENTAAVSAAADYRFDNLFVPFRCVAADIDRKQPYVFASGDLGEAIRASMAFPFYFPPVIDSGKVFYDGGLYNNFPMDVLKKEFAPDIIIGVNVVDSSYKGIDENLFSQVRTMIVQKTNYNLIDSNSILIKPDAEAGLLDFEETRSLVDSGYVAAMRNIERIKSLIQKRRPSVEINEKRKNFIAKQSPILIEEVDVSGITAGQASYVKKILKPEAAPINFWKLKSRYFKLAADPNIKKLFPKLLFNKLSGYFRLSLDIRQEQDFITQFGGNFASRPVNEGFIGAEYHQWGKQSLSLSANTYFGKLYTSGQVKMRSDFPGIIPFFIEPEITVNSWDFFHSSSAFFEYVKPPYLIQTDQNYALNLGLPVRNKGKLLLGSALAKISNDYYQSEHFEKSDTADRTNVNTITAYLNFERSTLNRKLYANTGSFLAVRLRYIEGNEYSIPGSTSVDLNEHFKHHEWWHLKFTWDDYFKQKGHLRMGFYSEAVISNQPFLSNYTATILSAPAFEPVQETKTLFLSNFHAHNYLGTGLKAIFSIRYGIELRLEGYAFQPYQEILRNASDFSVQYGTPFSKRYFIATAAAVYNSPIAPLSLSVNYYHGKDPDFLKSLSVMLHFGYIIFNKRALE